MSNTHTQETHEWDDPPGTDIQAYDPEAAARQLGIPPELDYYALLEVGREADAATIKRQYYILARKWHPGEGLCVLCFTSSTVVCGFCAVCAQQGMCASSRVCLTRYYQLVTSLQRLDK